MRRRVERTARLVSPVLAPAALGLLALGAALDMLAAGRAGGLTWLAFWAIACGVAAGTWFAAFALLDWILFAELGDRGTSGVGGFATALVVGLFGLAALLRTGTPAHVADAPAMALEVAATAILGMKTWIGRELAAWIEERR